MKTITELTIPKKEEKLIRLAPYIRVSSNSDDQLLSFAAQVRYYTDYTAAHSEYELVDIYADEGITGTEMKKRDDFNRLIYDCKKRKIDRIITKSISRFARNTTELLTVVRMLREIGVSVYFEEQGIDTETLDLEMILTFPGMAAQKESETISENMRWSYQKRMESGEFNCCRAAYGYELVNGELRVNDTEAAVVRRIFHLYLQGCGKQAIANQLNAEEVPKRYGYTTWHSFTIDYILNNERYMGDALLQKSYTTDALPYRKRRNRGEKAQFYVENSNPAIVSRETYQAAQELQKSKSKGCFVKKDRYPLSTMLKCPVCGHNYRRQIVNGKAYCSSTASQQRYSKQRRIHSTIRRTEPKGQRASFRTPPHHHGR